MVRVTESVLVTVENHSYLLSHLLDRATHAYVGVHPHELHGGRHGPIGERERERECWGGEKMIVGGGFLAVRSFSRE